MRKVNLFILFITLLSTGCLPYLITNTELPPIGTATYQLQPTETPRATPTNNYCDDATSAGARTKYTFEEILPCLVTIEEVSQFMAHNMMYDEAYDIRERGDNEYAPAWLIYERGVDDSDGHAILQCYMLESNGWDAVIMGMNINTPSGYTVCAVSTQGAIITLGIMGGADGPYASIEDAALHYVGPDGALGTLRASQITEITTNTSTPTVLDLPWNMIWKPEK